MIGALAYFDHHSQLIYSIFHALFSNENLVISLTVEELHNEQCRIVFLIIENNNEKIDKI